MSRGIAALFALAAVGLLLSNQARAASIFVIPQRREDSMPSPFPGPVPEPDPFPKDQFALDLSAFLYMIRRAEHSPFANDTDRYRTFYGGAKFTDFSDHPVDTGELRGVRLTDEQCRNAGFGPGCVSTAAGAYQIIAPTWRRVREAGAWGPRLPDFSPESQDEAARRILSELGALPMIASGDIVGAILTAGRAWASLPGSTAKQNPKSVDVALSFFNEGLRVA